MKLALAAISLCLTATTANAIDLKQLAPCRPAAAKYCDRSEGMTIANLLRCGAVLATKGDVVGNQCRQILRQYGQL